MYNDDEKKTAEQAAGEPSSDNIDASADQTEPTAPQVGQDKIAQSQPEAEQARYQEPWQQPVYREANAAGQEPFSPGLHNGGYNGYQKYQTNEVPHEKKKKSLAAGLAKAVCLILACAIVSAGATYGVIQYSISSGLLKSVNQVVLGGTTAAAGTDGATTDQVVAGTELSAEEIYSLATQQVVGVNSESQTNVFGQPATSAVSGSGFIISSDGYIVTNYHVISYAVEQGFTLTVMMHDGTSYPAKVIGYEPDNDVAVIKIEATGLDAVTIGNNDTMTVGDAIYAVGNPLGELDYTMTNGIVSALDREIQIDESTRINMFQIDAAVNSGNSGGPVYNSKGEVIGIVSAKYSSTGVEGLGFAIPINDAVSIAQQLISNGYVVGKPSMGISVRTVTSAAAQYYNLVEGAYVESVQSGSAAEKAGLKVGDIITKLGDTAVTSSETLKSAKKNFKAGETASIVVNRDGTEVTLSITFDEEGITSTANTQTTTTEQDQGNLNTQSRSAS